MSEGSNLSIKNHSSTDEGFVEAPSPYKNEVEYLDELRKLYQEDYGISLTDKQVRTIGREHDILLVNFL